MLKEYDNIVRELFALIVNCGNNQELAELKAGLREAYHLLDDLKPLVPGTIALHDDEMDLLGFVKQKQATRARQQETIRRKNQGERLDVESLPFRFSGYEDVVFGNNEAFELPNGRILITSEFNKLDQLNSPKDYIYFFELDGRNDTMRMAFEDFVRKVYDVSKHYNVEETQDLIDERNRKNRELVETENAERRAENEARKEAYLKEKNTTNSKLYYPTEEGLKHKFAIGGNGTTGAKKREEMNIARGEEGSKQLEGLVEKGLYGKVSGDKNIERFNKSEERKNLMATREKLAGKLEAHNEKLAKRREMAEQDRQAREDFESNQDFNRAVEQDVASNYKNEAEVGDSCVKDDIGQAYWAVTNALQYLGYDDDEIADYKEVFLNLEGEEEKQAIGELIHELENSSLANRNEKRECIEVLRRALQ